MAEMESPSLNLTLLGAPQVERDGVLIDVSLRKSMALLAYLAVTRTAQTRSALSALFWPEADEARAKGALRYTLSVLNSTIGDGWLHTTREQIGLDPNSRIVVDVHRVEMLVTRIRAHGHALRQPCAVCAPLHEELQSVMRGRLLSGFSLSDCPGFDEWQFFEGERLEQIRADTFLAMMGLYRASGNPATAVPIALRLLSLDSLSDDVNEALIRLYVEAGQHSAALRHYEAYTRLLQDELGVQPDPRLAQYIEPLRAKKTSVLSLEHSPTSSHRLLPAPQTPLVGRDHEIEAVAELLQSPATRLLTLVGPGGSGKSRLALAIAYAERDQRHRTISYLALAGIATPGGFISALANSLDLVQNDSNVAESMVVDRLRDEEMLIILDNLEHLLQTDTRAPDPLLDLLCAILENAPGVQFLITSRTRLQLQDEQLYPVRGLDYPEWKDVTGFDSYGAVQLFVLRARKMRPDFSLNAESIPHVFEIVRLLAGQPLALELAAAWVGVLSVEEIAVELNKNMDLLVSKARNVPDRQRSMRATYRFSWVRLQPKQQHILRALTVFRGGCTGRAAAEVAGATPPALQSLIDQSLLASQRMESGETRYLMHELLRQFASEEVSSETIAHEAWLKEEQRIRTLHARYYLRWVSAQMSSSGGPDLGQMLTAIEVEQDNIQAAWDWAIATSDVESLLQAISDLNLYYSRRGQTMIGIANCVQVIAHFEGAEPSSSEALLLGAAYTWRASFAIDQMQVTSAGVDLEHGLALLAPFPEEPISGLAAFTMARHASLCGALPETHRWVDQSRAIALANHDNANVAHAMQMKGRTYWLQGDYRAAAAQFGESLTRFRELEDQTNTIRLLSDLITTTAILGDDVKVTSLRIEAETLAELLVDPREAAHAHRSIGRALLNVGHFAAAQRNLESAIVLGQRHSRQGLWNDDLAFLGYTHLSQCHFDDVERLMSQLFDAARKRDRARDAGTAQMLRGLARIGCGEYEEAHRLLQEALAVYQPIAIADDQSFTLFGLSHTWRAQGDPESAKRVAQQALRLAAQSRSARAAGIALAAYVGVLLDESAMESAIEMEALVMLHPFAARSPFFRALISQPVEARITEFPPDRIVAAQTRGRKRHLLSVVDALHCMPDSACGVLGLQPE